MGLNGVSQVSDTKNYEVNAKSSQASQTMDTSKTGTAAKNTDAAIYKSSKREKTAAKPDYATIEKMKADAQERTSQLRSLVEKMMLKQGKAYNSATDIFGLLRRGELEIDPEIASQAQKDIAEDGYWGVEQTSERLVSFAKALSGNDPEKADQMIEAVKKGFEQATKSWGDKLPDISQRTLDTTIEKLNQWKDEIAG